MKSIITRRIFPLLLFALMLIFTGCSEYSDFDSDFYAGDTITPEQIVAISEGIASSDKADADNNQVAESTAKETKAPDTDEYGNIIVYWTEDGSVWHADRSCSAIINSTAVESGTIDEAQAAGKDRACKKCVQETEATVNN